MNYSTSELKDLLVKYLSNESRLLYFPQIMAYSRSIGLKSPTKLERLLLSLVREKKINRFFLNNRVCFSVSDLDLFQNFLKICNFFGFLTERVEDSSFTYYPAEKVEEKPKIRVTINNEIIIGIQFLNIRKIPEELFILDKIRYLEIITSDIYSIPEKIFSITTLEKLKINDTNILELPSRIQELKNLRHLDLSHNKLLIISSTIAQLKHLKILNINNNDIIDLPNELGGLHTLNEIRIEDNPIFNNPYFNFGFRQEFLTIKERTGYILNKIKNMKKWSIKELLERLLRNHPLSDDEQEMHTIRIGRCLNILLKRLPDIDTEAAHDFLTRIEEKFAVKIPSSDFFIYL